MVSEDFKATAIIGLLKANTKDGDIVAATKKIVAETPGPEPTYINGMAYIRAMVGKDIKGDLSKFLPAGLLIMLIFLYFAFRQLRGVILPFFVVVMSIWVGMGLIPLFGWKIQVVTVLLPVILIAVANDYGIHVIASYQEHNKAGTPLDNRGIVAKTIKELGMPVVFTGITTMAGLLSLLSHVIVPAEQMGILASLAVGWALLGSLMFIPAVLAVIPRAKPIIGVHPDNGNGNGNSRHLLDRMLHATARVVTTKPKTVIATLVILTCLMSTGIYFVAVDTNAVNYYDEESELRQSSDLVNEYFGGATVANVIVEGDIKDPKVLKAIDTFEKALKEHPNVGETSSLAKVVRQMNETMNDDDPAFDTIPDTRNAIAQYLLLYSMSGDPEDFDRMVDFPYEHALLTARINSAGTSEISEVVEFMEDYVDKDQSGVFKKVGGFGTLFYELVDAVVRGQIISLLLSLFIVAILVMILFRSFTAGILASAPLGLSMGALFGLMGYFGIELNIPTAMLSCIMIGVGIDYTIHYLWRYRTERQRGRDYNEAVFVTLTTTGRGITFNALSVMIGFIATFLSSFSPVQYFGFLVVVSISSCLVGALAFLPAVTLLLKPSFLEPKNQ